MPRSRKTKHYPWMPLVQVCAILTLSIIALTSYSLKNKTISPAPLLSVPTQAVSFTPGPLILDDIESTVLGAEVIDPVSVISIANQERIRAGSPPLRINRDLMKAAQLRANVILKHQNFSHQDPFENIILTTVLPRVGYQYAYASENIGMGDSSARGFINGFMNSPSHKANLLDPKLKDTGVAIVTGPYEQYYVNIAVHLFAIPGGEKERLGYRSEEIEEFRNAILRIDTKLAKAYTFLGIYFLQKREYYTSWITLLQKQRKIAVNIYHQMRQQKPFTNEHIALIEEYNNNWALAPTLDDV